MLDNQVLKTLPNYPNDSVEMIVEKESMNNLYCDVSITNYSKLEVVVIKKKSFNNIKQFMFGNNEKLKSIEIQNNTFENAKCVIIHSIFINNKINNISS